ncbi:acetyl-CoA carboxylase biotin carboxyl carrier protein [Ureibacillus xyleni]|uniref:Acetyl-CoA carboxylase biotin carboxyl carrier protein n=1 Tax=Ureibacillus xyleni TaxID=614648 RepID=A0A285RE42_9BACL|nr:acetyl-CoA carboxylase biotin carboxyl carrier protein subunit [Ureibacillus xyleni]SOB92341.1 acetyl-CoA carboxylase biotin carboxyl carrier protein [Ureibacillus xyleni]
MEELRSQMAGTVFEVLVKEGQQVTAGQTVIIIESMKMEIPFEAESDGVVSKIHVSEGDFVNEDDVLITFA